MLLQGRTYVPLLHARQAEMRALREMPDQSRSRLFPVIKLRPWLNSKTLEKAFENIDLATDGAAYGLDLDSFANDPASLKPARVEFARLFDPHLGFKNYYDAVEDGENRIPVFRDLSSQNPQIPLQISQVAQLDRGLFVRVSTRFPGRFLEVAQRCIDEDISNVVFIFDCGWNTNLLPQSAVSAGLINSLLDITEDYEVVIAGSSFPDAFGGNGTRFHIPAQERPLYRAVQAAVNRIQLVYGDWASTREPTDPTPMKNIPRIDTATLTQWNCWRSDGEDYKEVAERVVDDPDWSGNLDLWGDYMIQSTADGQEPSIKSAVMAAAVRINLHMIAQAGIENPDRIHLGDEPVGDDL